MVLPDRKPDQLLSNEDRAKLGEFVKDNPIHSLHLSAALNSEEKGPSGKPLGEIMRNLLNLIQSPEFQQLSNQSEDLPTNLSPETDISRE